jgi:hypothetical protein
MARTKCSCEESVASMSDSSAWVCGFGRAERRRRWWRVWGVTEEDDDVVASGDGRSERTDQLGFDSREATLTVVVVVVVLSVSVGDEGCLRIDGAKLAVTVAVD